MQKRLLLIYKPNIMYQVKIEKKVLKKVAKIPAPFRERIKKAILALSDDPRPTGCKKLKDRDAYRIREADYRIIYEIEDNILCVQVVAVGHRKDIYQ